MLRRVPAAFADLLSYRSPVSTICLSLFLLLFLGVVDYFTGDYSLIVFYVAPVAVATWFVGRRYGLFFSLGVLATRSFIEQSTSLHHTPQLYWNLLEEFGYLMIMSLLFSSLRRALDKEHLLASTDPLTGTLNRRSFFEKAEFELNRARRYKRPFSVAYIDLDNFKAVNDTFGHHIGDELLITVVRTIRENLRSYEILSRFGSDEFVILLPEADEEATLSFLAKIRLRLQEAMLARKWPVTASIGAVVYLDSAITMDEIIARADELMYTIKRSGKSNMLHAVIK